MSFYIRKSIRCGPIRFNLSKLGLGISGGVMGLRVGTGSIDEEDHILQNRGREKSDSGVFRDFFFKTGSQEEIKMSDLQKYIKERKARDPEFAKDFDTGYEQFKIGVVLKQAREDAGITQEELARRLNTKKTAISRIENHAEDIKLSTLEKFASALGKQLKLEVA